MPPSVPVVPLRAWVDPDDVFAAIADTVDDVFWLDAGPGAGSGWSWIGTGLPGDPDDVRAVTHGGGAPGEHGPFTGGWIGWIDYETGAARAGVAVAGDDDAPGERWLRVDGLLAFDHARSRVFAIGRDRARLADLAAHAPGAADPVAPGATTARARHDPDSYALLVERCRDRIRDGDAYQLCLTTRFAIDGEVDAVAAFRRLRRASPSHHGGLVRIGGVVLASATPERFVEVTGGVARTRPIKGTRPRSADPAVDRGLAIELRADPKERAENVMIVDLMRNDLSRVCRPGTVAVERLLEVESYPAVHQLVSTVSGVLRPGTTFGDVLDATFPAGSMTGAPKLSAMGILHGLEGAPRGVFAGCFGWVGDDGSADLAMVIRSIVAGPTGAYVGAGGGITWRSRALAEVREVALKARAPLAAAGAALPPGW